MVGLTDLPQDVLLLITNHLELPYKVRFALACKRIFTNVIPTVYHTVVYVPLQRQVPLASRNDKVIDHTLTIVTDENIKSFLQTISSPSSLGFAYSDFIINLFLEKLTNPDVFDLHTWRSSEYFPKFTRLLQYQFPNSLDVMPMTYENAPNLDTLVVDSNFCNFLDYNKGSIEFFNHENIKKIFFKGTLGKNEDMVIFKLITKLPHMIHKLSDLHFLIDSEENHEFVYRRIVGFFAILRKMNLTMVNVSKLTLVLTNVSSSTILSLLGKHIIFENLTDLSLFIQDDAKVLTLVKSLDKLSYIVSHHGFNIRKLLIKYELVKEDTDKNHLRSMMLLKLCESFRHLTDINIDLKIHGLDLSNLLMILGTPIAKNMDTLQDVRINIFQPSENLIGNIIPTLEDAMQLFHDLNFLDNCSCHICKSILQKLQLTDPLDFTNLTLFNETIKVSTLLIIGQELDRVQRDCHYTLNADCMVNGYSRFIRLNKYSRNGYLFDHLISRQLNHSLNYMSNLQVFEICGLVYAKFPQYETKELDVTRSGCQDFNNDGHTFRLLYGNKFTGLDENIITNIAGLGRVFSGSF